MEQALTPQTQAHSLARGLWRTEWMTSPRSVRDPVLDRLVSRATKALARAEAFVEELLSDRCTMDAQQAAKCKRLARTNNRRARAMYGAWMTLSIGLYMPEFEKRSVAVAQVVGA